MHSVLRPSTGVFKQLGFLFRKQGKIVAELQPTEARLRQACMRKVPQVIKEKQSSAKKVITTTTRRSNSGRLLTASGGRL